MFLDTVRGKNGGVEFWQIAVDKANSEEYFGESDRSLVVVSSIVGEIFGELCIIHQICSLSNIFPCTLTTLVPIP